MDEQTTQSQPQELVTEQKLKSINQYQTLLTPMAIVLAGGLIAGAVLYTNNNPKIPVATDTSAKQEIEEEANTEAVRPVSGDDHIKGNPDAPIKIIEYSDFECPFCQRFHNTMNEIMDIYGDSGDVAWVFRQFPLEQLHPVKARQVAMASECANEQGGNDMFWKFTDKYFELTLTNNRTNTDEVISQIAKEIGLDNTKLQVCIESEKYAEHIDADIANAVESGGRGTPWSVLVTPNGIKVPINGALPIDAIKQLIEVAKTDKN